jgi:hypothetical protein
MVDDDVDLAFLARQQDVILSELCALRKNVTVMIDIVSRLDQRVFGLETTVQSLNTKLADTRV